MRKRSRHHRRLVTGAVLTLAATGLFASSVSAAVTEVDISDERVFDPRAVTVAVGGRVQWAATGVDEHSVIQNSGLFGSGVAQSGLEFTRKFSAGTFRYHCEEHAAQGMRGVVRVPPRVRARPAGLPFTVAWAPGGPLQTGDRFDVEYRVGTGAWKSWRRNTTTRSKVFGARNRPVRVRRGKTYSFRVVSRSSDTAVSAVSPTESFVAR